MSRSSAQPQSDCPEYGVRYETISGYFDPPMARSTFHDLVNKGRIIPMKGMRGFYLLNESLRRLGLKEVRELPNPVEKRDLEDIARLAFTLIDRDLFPAPPWLLQLDVIDPVHFEHARRLADEYRGHVEALDSVQEKLHYFAGVLDAQVMLEKELGEGASG